MKIKYLGPAKAINVVVVGPHVISHSKGEVFDYPEGVAKDLLAEKKNKFVAAAKNSSPKKNGQRKTDNGQRPVGA